MLAVLVGLEKLCTRNLVDPNDTTVVVLTGSGLKSSDFFIENVKSEV